MSRFVTLELEDFQGGVTEKQVEIGPQNKSACGFNLDEGFLQVERRDGGLELFRANLITALIIDPVQEKTDE